MKDNKNNTRYLEDNIDLKYLFKSLWSNKITILSCIILFGIAAAVISAFVITPVYNTKLNIVISMPEKYNTRYGEYILPITTNQQYINLIRSNDVLLNTINDMSYNMEDVNIENLEKRISISESDLKSGNINSFEVTVSANNPEESLKLAQALYSNYLDFLDAMTKERTVNYYINIFNVELKSLYNNLDSTNEILNKNEELLAQTPQLIKSKQANLEIQTQLNSSSNYIVPVDTVNPNYIKIENDIIESKQTIISIENSIRMYKKYIDELDKEMVAINKYYRTGEAEKLESSIIGVIDTYVYLPSAPVAPHQKSSPSITLNTAIGLVLGCIMGVIITLVKEYWYKDYKNL